MTQKRSSTRTWPWVHGTPPQRRTTSSTIKSGIFGQPEAKVHLGQAWRIEFPYRNIHEYWARSKGRVRDTVSRARPFDRAQYS